MDYKGYSANIFLAFVWSSYLVLARLAVMRLPLCLVGFVSRFVAVLGLVLLISARKQLSQAIHTQGKLVFLVLIGVVAFMLDLSGYIGLRYSTAINGSILLRTDILFVVLLGHILLGEKVYWPDWACITAMVFGSLMVMNIDISKFRLYSLGDIMFLISAVLIVCNAFVIKIKLRNISSSVIGLYNSIGATICYFFFVMFLGDYQKIAVVGSSFFLLSILILMGIADILLYLSYYYSLKRLPVWVVRTVLLSMPIFNVVLGRIFLGETMQPVQILGMFVILGAGLILILKHPTGPEVGCIATQSDNGQLTSPYEVENEENNQDVCACLDFVMTPNSR